MASWTSDDPIRLVTLIPPVTEEDLALVADDTEMVQFQGGVPEAWVLERLEPAFAARPATRLRVLGARDGLEHLALVPGVRHVALEGQDGLPSLDGLRHLPPELESLTLHASDSSSLSIAPLTRFERLRELSLTRVGGDLDALGELLGLETLLLRSVRLEDCTPLGRLPRLRRFELRLGGTASLRGIEGAPLEYLEIWQVRGLGDLVPIAGLRTLRVLFLQSLRQVTALPDLSATALEHAWLENMKGLVDFRGLAAAPALQELHLYDMRHVRWEHLSCFEGHPRLAEGIVHTGSARRDAELTERLGLRRPPRRPWPPS
ncbi:MAG TPA: hypothetical protein VM266_03860 [Solirubrobacteraceae bacterium]|nr:hypothetical protein [Solirubrobacteraceae bacterium]